MLHKFPPQPEMSSRVPPALLALFGDPALLPCEDPSLYKTLRDEMVAHVEPADIVEWLWIRDLVNLNWEIGRLWRIKRRLVEIKRDEVVHNRELRAVPIDEDDPPCEVKVPESEKDFAELFKYVLDDYQRVDRLIASAEVRRDRLLVGIGRRRKETARRLREASQKFDLGREGMAEAA